MHAAGPLLVSALALGAMAVWLEVAPALAFLMLIVATLLWGPAGILSSLPASFLHVRPESQSTSLPQCTSYSASTLLWRLHAQLRGLQLVPHHCA